MASCGLQSPCGLCLPGESGEEAGRDAPMSPVHPGSLLHHPGARQQWRVRREEHATFRPGTMVGCDPPFHDHSTRPDTILPPRRTNVIVLLSACRAWACGNRFDSSTNVSRSLLRMALQYSPSVVERAGGRRLALSLPRLLAGASRGSRASRQPALRRSSRRASHE